MPTVLKQVLAPGTYWVRGKPVTFTADDMAHFAKQGKAMLKEKLPVRLPLEHQDWADPYDDDERKAKEVEYNRGFVTNFLIDRDKSLWAELDIPRKEVAAEIKAETKFVSPRILPEFTDGSGKKWENVIGHIALTPQPVWHGQKPFGESMLGAEPVALSMLFTEQKSAIDLSLSDRVEPGAMPAGAKVWRRQPASIAASRAPVRKSAKAKTDLANPLDPMPVPVLSDKKLYERVLEYLQDHIGEGESMEALYQMLGRTDDERCEIENVIDEMVRRGLAKKTEGGMIQLLHAANFSNRPGAINMAADEDKTDGEGSGDENAGLAGDLGTVTKYLEQFGIHLPPDTDTSNFLERLTVALHALTNGGPDAEDEPGDDMLDTNAKPESPPATVNMSHADANKVIVDLSARLKKSETAQQRLQQQLGESRLGGITEKIDGLVSTGRLAPVKATAWKKELAAKPMSLVVGNDAAIRRILDQMELATELPEGAVWTPEERAAKANAAPAEKPQWHDFSGRGNHQAADETDVGEMTPERVEKLLKPHYPNYQAPRYTPGAVSNGR